MPIPVEVTLQSHEHERRSNPNVIRQRGSKKRARRTVFEAKLSASPSKLMRLQGLPEALAELAEVGVPSGHMPLREACQRVAAALPCPEGPVILEAVRLRRRIVAHRICDRDSAIRIAHGVAARHTMRALVRKGLSKIAKRAGLRDARPRPWHSDPQIAARLEVLTNRFFDGFRPFLVDGDNGGPWGFALVAPHPSFGDNSGADALVIMSAEKPSLECVHLGPSCRPLDFASGRDERIRLAISEALATTDRLVPDNVWRHSDSLGSLSAAREIAPMEEWPQSNDYGFWRRFSICWQRSHERGIAHFRRRLPPEVQDHAALAGRQFGDLRQVAEFFARRQAWSLQDYQRANQAIRTIPILRHAITQPEVHGLISAGRPIEEVIRAAITCDRPGVVLTSPLHPKTVRSLGKSYRLSVTTPPATTSNFSDVVPIVEALYKANPHHLVLDGTELEQIRGLVKFDRVEQRLSLRAALAHRNDKGKIRRCPELSDPYAWIYQRAGIVLYGSEDHPGERHSAIAEAAYDVVFPEGRTLAGLTALNRSWHEEQRRLDEAFARLKSSLLTSRIEAVQTNSELYPHFLNGEITIDRVAMRPLVREDDIIAEGDALDHCVGRYVGGASAGRSMLVSQISEAGRSTVEVYLDNDTTDGHFRWRLAVAQNKAISNTPPPPSHVTAMSKLLKSVGQDVLSGLDERIRKASLIVDRHRGDIYRALPREDVELLRDQAFADLQRFMPRALRKLPRAAWQELYPPKERRPEDHPEAPAIPF